jgi:uncharacterized repeat protein (TIGR01451 family)
MSDGSTHFTINPGTRRRWARPSRTSVVAVLFFTVLVATITGFSGIAFAANPAADIDQCANDQAPSPNTDGCNSNANQWVNGNLGASKSFYKEGDSIPYRLKFTNLATSGSHNVIIEWDTTKSDKHALDYITTFNRTVANANPCLGVSGCNPGTFTTFAIPADPQVTGAGVTPVAGNFQFYGGTITSVSAYSYPNGAGFTGDKSARITITFTASVANPVLAWGGHIATRADWGTNNSAVAISGSPYHTRLIDLDGSGGNQDRSLSAEAVVFPASITIVKNAVPNDPQDFSFTSTGGLTPANPILDDDAGAGDSATPNSQAYNGIENFTTYTFTEASVPDWVLTFGDPVCTVTTPNGGSQSGNLGTRTLTVNLAEGENVTCTFINSKQNADIAITKVADAGTVNAGEQIGFTITVTNIGPGTAQGVTLSDTLPTGSGLNWSIDAVNSDTGCSISTGSLTCNFGTLASGSSKHVHITSPTTSASCGPVNNTADVTTSNDGSDSASDSIEVQCAAIDVAKEADDPSVSAGDTIGFTITVTNNGAGVAKDVTLTDTLPTDTGTSWSIDGGTGAADCAIAAGVLTCDFGDMASGASFTVHISSPTTAGTAVDSPVDNTADVTTSNDGSDSASDEVEVLGAAIDVAKEADDPSVSAGDTIGFTITVTNNGAGVAKDVTLTDTLPTDTGTSWSIDGGTGAADCAIAAGVLTCDFGDMASGASFTVHISSPTSFATCGTVTNTASVAGSNDGSDSDSDSVTVQCPSLTITKTANPVGPVDAGNPIGFDIVVSNGGPGVAKSVTVNDPLPTGSGISWSINPAVAGCSIAANTLTCSLGDLASGASVTIHVTSPTTTASCGTHTNQASASATNHATVQSQQASVTVQCPSLTITKTANPVGPVDAGNPIGFDIVVSNGGPGVAKSVTVNDPLPTGSGISWSINPAVAGCSIAANTLTCSLGDLASGASVTIHVTSPTTTASCGTYTNQASASATNHATVQSQQASVTVNCPKVGQITPTGTTCNQFNEGTATTLSELLYTTRNGQINSVAPGVFFYWIKVTAVAGGNTFTVNQSVTPAAYPFFSQASGSFVFNSSCLKVSTQTIGTSNGVTTINFTAPSAGTYIIGIKYDSGSVKGFAPPIGQTSAHYDFSTGGVPGSTQGINLNPKP